MSIIVQKCVFCHQSESVDSLGGEMPNIYVV